MNPARNTVAMIDAFMRASPPPRRDGQEILHVLAWPYLALAFEIGNVETMQLHEAVGNLQRFLSRFRFDDRVAADDFLGFGEGSVGDLQLATLLTDANGVFGRLQACGVFEPALAETFGDER